MKPCPYPIADLLPHKAPMILLDHVIGMDQESLQAAVRVTSGRLFFEDGRGMPAHVALEWMAQACGAWAGAQALDAGAKIKLGLLLGTRSFRAECAWLEEGRMFTVQASLNYMDNEIGVFDCSVTDTASRAEVAVAQLTVYQSDQIDNLLLAHQQSGQS
jgi:predicted hotdog family 3-hydroxylacyl-ACP dehydratase